MVKKAVNQSDDQQLIELTADIQRLRADFENYRKRIETEKQIAREQGETAAIAKLLPIIDTIDRAVAHTPDDVSQHPWVLGIKGLIKQLDTMLSSLDVNRIEAYEGVHFNPEIHQAVQFDEDSEGDIEVVTEELQAGYLHKGRPMRPAMVRAGRTQSNKNKNKY